MDPATIAALVLALATSLAKLAELQSRLANGQEPTEDDQRLLRAEQDAEMARLAANTGHSADFPPKP